MEILYGPIVRLWNWVERIGGYPGQVFFCVTAVMLVILVFTIINNKK
jgi:hypothetical protein